MSMRTETRSKRLTVYPFTYILKDDESNPLTLSTLIQAGTVDYTIWRSWHTIIRHYILQSMFSTAALALVPCSQICLLHNLLLESDSLYTKSTWIISQAYGLVYQHDGWDNDSGKWSWPGFANMIVVGDSVVLYFSPQSTAFVVSTPSTTCQDHQDNQFTSTASAHSSVLLHVLVKLMLVAHVHYVTWICMSQLSMVVVLGFSWRIRGQVQEICRDW